MLALPGCPAKRCGIIRHTSCCVVCGPWGDDCATLEACGYMAPRGPPTQTGLMLWEASHGSCLSSVVPVTLASPGNLFKRQILGLTPDLLSYKEALGLGPSHRWCSQLSTLKFDVIVLLASWSELESVSSSSVFGRIWEGLVFIILCLIVKPSGSGLFTFGRFWIPDSAFFLVRGLFRFASSSWFSLGRLCVSRHLSISSGLSKLLAYSKVYSTLL